MIVADTGALLALLHDDEEHHADVRASYDDDPDAWILPWAILPEMDYLLRTRSGLAAARLFFGEVAEGRWAVEWGDPEDLRRAYQFDVEYDALNLGLVDGVVMAVAERLKAEAIATLDLRHFASVKLVGNPRLLPRDV